MSEDMASTTKTGVQNELVLTRIIDAAPSAVYRCWTEPELMKRWFTPKPWETVHVETDVRVGGASLVVMRSPEGQEFPNRGVYLEVVPGQRIVFTDAYTSAWEPSGKAFFTGIITFEATGDGKTLYTARGRHWSAEDCEQHKTMGFHEGWGTAADQLEAVAKTL